MAERKTTTKKATTKSATRTTRAKSETKAKEEPKKKVVEEEVKTSSVAIQENAETEFVDKRDIEIETLKAQLAQLQQMVAMGQQTPQVIQVPQSTEQVHFLWQAPVADDNQILFGDGGMYGRIVGKTGEFFVPKTDLSRILNAQTRMFLDYRWLIVVSGMNDEEREALGVNYKEGELLTKKAFARLPDLGESLVDIYSDLCDSHKEIVEKVMYEEFKSGNPNIHRDVVVKLNKLCEKKENAFRKIIEELNEQDAE